MALAITLTGMSAFAFAATEDPEDLKLQDIQSPSSTRFRQIHREHTR